MGKFKKTHPGTEESVCKQLNDPHMGLVSTGTMENMFTIIRVTKILMEFS